MKLSKLTTILIDVALVLLIVILIKSFIAFPKNANAAPIKEYQVVNCQPRDTQGILNAEAEKGWGLVGYLCNSSSSFYLIFGR